MDSTCLFAHVDHVLVAEFDIDKGSSITYQYPEDTGTDVHMLADLMIPDGAHLREEDWTILIVSDADLPPSPPTSKEKPLLYVLNLVRTKHISGVRRGARVKAMALTSRHHWVHAFKPLLLLALDKYFNAPSESIVVELYNSINATDCSLIPPLSTAEKRILRSSEDRTLFEGKFGGDIGLDGERLAQRSFSVDSTATGLTVRDGQRPAGVSKATNKDRHFYETRASYSGIKVPIRIPLTIYPEEIGDFTVAKLLSCFGHSTALNPPKSSKDSPPPLQWKNGAPFCWHPHLDSGPQTHPLVVLLSALLTEKRVIFLGDKRPSGEVAQYVLAACSLAGGGGSIVRGFAERCFPYVSLAGLDTLLSVTGYVAGVTNPVFEEQPSWWDVLCNINTGKITVSPQLISAISPDSKELNKENEKDWMRTGYWEGDNEFVQETILAVQSHTGELHVRQRFHDYIRKLVDVCAAFEIDLLGPTKIAVLSQHTSAPELGYGPFFPDLMTRKREIAILRNRVEAWRQTTSYKKCQLVGSQTMTLGVHN
ncbi:stabilization of polarity axis-domain-containing protein [Phlyctochytrium arcticum]|nr:stabilization of polarity axis-domain-containing protein [Phlyctochytrium arcticum]